MIDEKALAAAIHVYKASYYASPNVAEAVRCAIVAYEHARTRKKPLHELMREPMTNFNRQSTKGSDNG